MFFFPPLPLPNLFLQKGGLYSIYALAKFLLYSRLFPHRINALHLFSLEREPPVVDDKPCYDEHEQCYLWKYKNHCDTKTEFMVRECPVSCEACATSIQSTSDFGVEQDEVADLYILNKISAVIRESKAYMRKLRADPRMGHVRETCRNNNALCSMWAAQGECERNPAVMMGTCGPACHSCDAIDFDSRCPKEGMGDEPVLKEAGDLNRLFERIVDQDENEFSKLAPVVIQRPYKSGETRERTWNLGPWMLSFEKFLTDEEADRLVEVTSSDKGFGRSEEVTKKINPDGTYERKTSSYRSSSNTWCGTDCEDDPTVRGIIERISNVTGIATVNSEPLQVLKYEVDERYGEHADYIQEQTHRPCGGRILTLLIYLSDDFTGGETKFRFLREYTVRPKKGMAVLWSNVKNSNPLEEEERFDHEALPVTSGVKYAANAWIHMRNFRDNAEKLCV